MFKYMWIKMSLIVILELQFTAALTEQPVLVLVVRDGDDVTLPCEYVTEDQDDCDGTTWLMARSGDSAAVQLIEHGHVGQEAKSKSDRLSVTQNCSLVIKKVTLDEDGYYTCRQTRSGKDTHLHLFVLSIVEMDVGKVSCSVSKHDGRCRHRVEWLDEDNTVNGGEETSRPECQAVFTLATSLLEQTHRYPEALKCKVTNVETQAEDVFAFSKKKPGGDMTPVTTAELMTTPDVSDKSNATEPTAWWLYFTVAAVVSAALTVSVVGVIGRRRSKGKRTEMDGNDVQSLNPAQEISPDMDDPEDGVSYASVSFTKKKSSGKGQMQEKDDGEGGAVTYGIVRTSYNSPAAVSSEPSNIYASVNKPNKHLV